MVSGVGQQARSDVRTMPRRMPTALLAAAALVAVVTLTAVYAPASSHPSYPLGKATHCRHSYYEELRLRWVHGRKVNYVDCVWRRAPRHDDGLHDHDDGTRAGVRRRARHGGR